MKNDCRQSTLLYSNYGKGLVDSLQYVQSDSSQSWYWKEMVPPKETEHYSVSKKEIVTAE